MNLAKNYAPNVLCNQYQLIIVAALLTQQVRFILNLLQEGCSILVSGLISAI